jgi:hypothetical protein
MLAINVYHANPPLRLRWSTINLAWQVVRHKSVFKMAQNVVHAHRVVLHAPNPLPNAEHAKMVIYMYLRHPHVWVSALKDTTNQGKIASNATQDAGPASETLQIVLHVPGTIHTSAESAYLKVPTVIVRQAPINQPIPLV